MHRLGPILVVDGSAVARGVVTRMLRPRAAEVIAVEGCAAAIELLCSRPFEWVVAEVDGPEGGGLRLLEHVNGLEDPRPGVVLVTRHPDAAEETWASLHGAIGYLSKPLSIGLLARALASEPVR